MAVEDLAIIARMLFILFPHVIASFCFKYVNSRIFFMPSELM